jgi:hypothetical protein
VLFSVVGKKVGSVEIVTLAESKVIILISNNFPAHSGATVTVLGVRKNIFHDKIWNMH